MLKMTAWVPLSRRILIALAALSGTVNANAQEPWDLISQLEEEQSAASHLDAPEDYFAARRQAEAGEQAYLASLPYFPLTSAVSATREFSLTRQELDRWIDRQVVEHQLEFEKSPIPLSALVYRDFGEVRDVGDWLNLEPSSSTYFLKVSVPGATSLGLILSPNTDLPGAVALAYGASVNPIRGPRRLLPPGDQSSLLLPAVEGDTVFLEVRGLPSEYAEAPPAASPFSIAIIVSSPAIRSTLQKLGKGEHPLDGDNLDWMLPPRTTCSPYTEAVCTGSSIRHATVRLNLCGQYGCGWCSGSLMRDNDSSTDIPYILTAGHCGIRTGDSLFLGIFYETGTCAGSGTHSWYQELDVPRVFRLGSEYTGTPPACGPPDWALLRFNRPSLIGHVPSFLTPKSTMPAWFQAVYSFHHPNGEFKKYSTGDVSTASYHPSTISIALDLSNHTEGGSSGAPWVDVDDNLQFGINICGPACTSIADIQATRFSYVATQIQRFLTPALATPFINSILAPATSLLGNEVLVRVDAQNIGSFASPDGHIHIAFPQLGAVGDSSLVRPGSRSPDLDYVERERNQTMYDRDGNQPFVNWVHVEFPDSIGSTNWTAGESNFTEVYAKPKQAGAFDIYYRVAMVAENDFYYNAPSDSTADLIESDQHWGVEKVTVQVYGPPSGVTATDGTQTDKVVVGWSSLTGASSYQVFRNTSNSLPSSFLATGLTTSPYNDTGATPGTLYYYWVKPCDAVGCGSAGGPDTGYRGLVAPTGVSATDGASSTKVTVSWGSVSGAQTYQVFRNTTTSLPASPLATGLAGSPYDDASATAGTLYYYWVKACSSAGCGPAGGPDAGFRQILAPGNVQASDGAFADRVEVSWDTVLGAQTYDVYRNTSSTLPGNPTVSGLTSSPYGDTSASVGTPYYYWVRGVSSATGSGPTGGPDSGYRGGGCTYSISHPNGGETLTKGTQYSVTWSRAGSACGSNVKLDLYKGGALNSSIASTTSGAAQAFAWTVPAGLADGTDYRVRITDLTTSSYWDESNANFTIQAAAPCSYSVIYPNGGETLTKGTQYSVTWSRTGSACGSNVKLDLYKSGALNSSIASTTSGAAQAYAWTVPAGLADGTDYRVRITDLTTSSYWDESNANFTIQAAASCMYVVTYPNGGETLTKGTQYSVTWSRAGSACGTDVKLDLYKGGVLNSSIASTTSGAAHTFAWAVPMGLADGADYRVRIADLTTSSYWDDSDSNFNVVTGGIGLIFADGFETANTSAWSNGGPSGISGLVGYWPFDTDSNDHSGHNNVGAWSGGGTLVAGRFGSAASFVQGQHYTIPNSTTLRTFTALSVSAWFKPTEPPNSSGGEDLFGGGLDGEESRYTLTIVPPSGVTFGAYNTSLVPSQMPSAYAIPNFLGQWHHLASVWDGSVVRVYVDGAQVLSGTFSGTISVPPTSPLFVNRHDWWGGSGTSSRLTGQIDDLAIFDRALSPAEVLALSSDSNSNGVADFWDAAPPPTVTSSFYHFDEGSGTVATDAIGGHTGTVSGATWVTGHSGTALSFGSPATSAVAVPRSVLNNLGNSVFAEAWIYPTARSVAPDSASIFTKRGAYNDWSFTVDPTGHVCSGLSGAGGINGIGTGACSTTTVPLNQWTKVATSYDGTTMRIYVNGVVDASATQALVLDWAAPTCPGDQYYTNGCLYGIWIGATSTYSRTQVAPNSGFKGIIDELRIGPVGP